MSPISEPTNEYHTLLSAVATQMMGGNEVVVEDKRFRVEKVGSGRLRCTRFTLNGRQVVAIEQNKSKPSRWGRLAKEGHQVVQFQDQATRKYLAVSVDGTIFEYGKH